MALNNFIFSFLLLILGYFFTNYFLSILKNSKINMLSDNEFKKPQAFHEDSTYRLGGIIVFSLFILVLLYLFFYKNIFFPQYITFCTLFFLLGLVDDFNINIAPKFRLFLMIFFLIVLVIFNEFYISLTGLEFLDYLLKIDIFSLIFMCLCFLFIINGANLVDGFNGLLSIHTLIILMILFVINLINDNHDLVYILFFSILLTLIFIKFNFPKAQMFLGDSGAYFFGALIAISVIETSMSNPSIPPFFFCILLSYLFFEVFFSFFRKIFVARQSPLLPDAKHLHMFLYKLLLKKNKKKLEANYSVTLYINSIYFLLTIPSIFFIENGLLCRYYFFSLLIIYIYFYKMLYEKVKKII